jgi:hypothetical protein
MVKDFGCPQCWPSAADAAWAVRGKLALAHDLVDESHVRVTIRACAACGQRFLSVFTETIDWDGGDDPQYWTLMPLTEAEAARLVGLGSALNGAALEALGRDRRCLRRDHPKDGERTYWGIGMVLGPHD